MAVLSVIEKVLNGGAKVLDEVITTKEETQKLLNELEELVVRDRESARKMYEVDSEMQKKIVRQLLLGFYGFLVCYMAMLFYPMFFPDAPQIPDVANSFISMIFGFFTAKIGTIVDFFFGGAKSSNDLQNKRK